MTKSTAAHFALESLLRLYYCRVQAMLLEQGYGQQLGGHLQQKQSPVLLQRDVPMLHFDRGIDTEAAPRTGAGPAAQGHLPHRTLRSVYTQTSPERLGSYEEEPGMSHAHEVRSLDQA